MVNKCFLLLEGGGKGDSLEKVQYRVNFFVSRSSKSLTFAVDPICFPYIF